MNKIHLTDPPFACSSCGGQYVERQHVDFGAAWDGPMIPSEHIAGHQPVSIDDLILCDECVRAAARLIGMEDRDDETISRLAADVDTQSERLAGSLRYVAALEQTIAERDNLAETLGIQAKPPAPAGLEAKPRRKVKDAPQA